MLERNPDWEGGHPAFADPYAYFDQPDNLDITDDMRAPFGREDHPVAARQTIRHGTAHPSSIRFFMIASISLRRYACAYLALRHKRSCRADWVSGEDLSLMPRENRSVAYTSLINLRKSYAAALPIGT